MARPAANAPHGGNYDDDGEAEDERPVPRTAKRAALKQMASQPPRRREPEGRRPSEPDDMPWQDIDQSAAKDEFAVPGADNPSSADREARPLAEPEPVRRSRAPETPRDEQAVAVPLPEPTYPPPLKEDPDWEADEALPEAKSESVAKPAKVGKRRGSSVGRILWLIVLAIVAASISAAVVLFLF